MSDKVKLAAVLPGDRQINGLDDMAGDIAARPDRILVALVWLDTPKTTVNNETGMRVPTVRVRRIEPLGDADEVPAAVQKEALRLSESRLGMVPLPFDEVETSSAGEVAGGIEDDRDDEAER